MDVSTQTPPGNQVNEQLPFRVLMLLLSGWFLGSVFYVTLSRISYPFDLEWMEGNSLVQMLRLLEGKQLYIRPSLEYIPYIYPPFYYYLSAFLAKLTNVNWFLPLRLVSLGASTGILVSIFLIVKDQTRSRFWGFVAAGFFAATFRTGGAWFDIARVDMLFIFLLLAATYLLQLNKRPANLAAGVLFACALLTKQTAVFPIFCLLVYGSIFLRRQGAIETTMMFIVVSAALIWYENFRSGGWFWYYVFTLPSHHSLFLSELAYLGQPIILLFPVIIGTVIGFSHTITHPRNLFNGREGIWPVFALVMLVTSILASLNPGSYNNNYVPYYAAISILFGINLARLPGWFSGSKRGLKLMLINAVCLAQFFTLFYNPLAQIPTEADLQAGQELVTRLRKVDGDVFAPNHNALPILAGKRPFAHLIALQEFHGNFGQPELQKWAPLKAEIDASLENHRFGAILLDRPDSLWVELTAYYQEQIIPYSSKDEFWPVTGGRTRPEYLYIH
jgi:hypothetical protein